MFWKDEHLEGIWGRWVLCSGHRMQTFDYAFTNQKPSSQKQAVESGSADAVEGADGVDGVDRVDRVRMA